MRATNRSVAPIAPPRLPLSARLRRQIGLTRLVLLAERLARCFWPLWTLVLFAGAIVWSGLVPALPPLVFWGGAGLFGAGALVALIVGARRFRWPSLAQARTRLDDTLPGRPIGALLDTQQLGDDDPGSIAVWDMHQARMAERADNARAPEPDLRLARFDRFGLRLLGLCAVLAMALFGAGWQTGSLPPLAGGDGAAQADQAAWEGWIAPPGYTHRPSLYLNDIAPGALRVPRGSAVTLRFYGRPGALVLDETVSGNPVGTRADNGDGADTSDPNPVRDFDITQSGTLSIQGPGGADWQVDMIPDTVPTIAVTAPIERRASGEIAQPFQAQDDYGVVSGSVTITLDLDAVDRRHGLATAPDARPDLVVDLPMPIAGDTQKFQEVLIEDFSKHPWAQLPVQMAFAVQDDLGQTGAAAPVHVNLGGRRFFDPLAAAIIEQRRDLLWALDNGRRVTQLLRAISYLPQEVFRGSEAYLPFRIALRRLESGVAAGLTPEVRDEVAEALWLIALSIEDGDLSGALERLRRAQERLSEAIRNGASDEEIAQLMDELNQAMQDYIRQLAQQSQQQPGDQQQAENQQGGEITPDQLQQMLDQIEQLMREGRMAEAQQMLNQLQQMLENMQVTQGGQGQGGQGQSPGQQALDGLADTLRDQQGLSDDSFRELQDQFSPGAPNEGQGQTPQGNNGQTPGQNPGQAPGQGQQAPGQGQGQQGQNPGQQGQNQGAPGPGQGQTPQGQTPGQGATPGPGQGMQPGGPGQNGQTPGRSLAQRQRDLQRQLERQRQQLPGLGGEAGRAARDALDEAGRAMERAEGALNDGDLPSALNDQSDAMEALREGMRNMSEALAQQQGQPGQQGQAMQDGEVPGGPSTDPLGREAGGQGNMASDENMLGDQDPAGRARELMDEIRRRSSDPSRPEAELDYLRRLLDRF